LILLAALQDTEISVLTVENVVHRASAVTLTMDGKTLTAVLKTPEGEKRLACDMIVEVGLGPRAPEPPADPEVVRLELTTRDVFYGTLMPSGEADATVKIKTELFGEQEIGYGRIRWLGRTAAARQWAPEPPADTGMSHIFLVSGDQVMNVTLQSLDSKGVRFKQEKQMKRKLDQVAAIYFMAAGAPPSEGKDLVAMLDLEDGSRIRGTLTKFDSTGAALKDLFGTEYTLKASAVRSISFRNGRVTYLSDLTPTAVEENANYIRASVASPGDLERPYRVDRNAKGGPLSIRGRAFRKGIGVHAYSSLTFDLKQAHEKFLVTLGIDDVTAGLGDAIFEIYADGTKVASETLRGRDAPKELSLDVANVSSLRLVVDFGEGGGVADYGDWASARLIRKP
jgi:hypothetical protein